MRILHLALGGCLKSPPIDFGITADTGGHIAYVLDAAAAQAREPGVTAVTIVTRLFDEPHLGACHAWGIEDAGGGVMIARIATADRRYLEKEALAADLPAFIAAFCDHLAALPVLPGVIHAHFADAAAVAIAVRRRFGIPFVYTPHALGIDKRDQGFAGEALERRIAEERRAIAEADAIIVSTRDEAERQVRAYGVAAEGRIACLPPGVPHRAARTGPTLVDRLGDWLDAPERPIILAIARAVEKKNLAGLVRAYAASPELRERANLVVLAGQHGVRPSEEETAVLAEITDLCADDAVRGRIAVPPRHDSADVTALYDRAATGGVFVNPAFHEPFGLTLIEAAEAGVPVVATCHGGPGEIVAAIGHGLLIDPRDPAGIAAACLRVIAEPGLHPRLAAAARAGVGQYDWGRYARAAIAVYTGCAQTPALLACDIDNTLTGCVIGAAAFTAWRRTSPLPFVVATGRSFDAARAVLTQWRLPEPDAYIVDVGTRIMLPSIDGVWREWTDFADMLERNWDRGAIADALEPLALTPQPAETAGPHKLSFFGDAADAGRIRGALAVAGLAARVVFSHGELIDVLAPAGGKAAAVAAYAALIGLTPAQCVAAGDSGNDIDMLDACGAGIVVGNAGEELAGLAARTGLHRAAARHAAGVMEGLERFGLTAVPVAAQASIAA